MPLAFTPGAGGGSNKPKPKKPSSYFSSYVSVYVKPDPEPEIVTFVPPTSQSTTSQTTTPSYDPLSSITVRQPKTEHKVVALPPPNIQVPLVAYTSGDINTAKDIERRYQDLIQNELLPDDIDYQDAQAAFERADVQALSDEQKLRIDYLLGTEHDPLVRSMLLALKHEGIPGHLSFDEYMGRFAEWGLVEESDQRAWQVIQDNIEDLTNDRWKSARAIDLNSGEEVLVRAGSKEAVFLQDKHKRMLEGRDIALIHNHHNNSPASDSDLQAALDLGVMFLVLVTPAGLQYHYRRSGDKMKLVEVINNPAYVALPSPQEDEESRAAYEAQIIAEWDNPAEIMMRQGEATAVIEVSGSFRAYGNQWYADARRAEPKTFMNYDFTDEPQEFRVLGRSTLNQSLVMIEVRYPDSYQFYRHWISLEDLEGNYKIRNGDLDDVPILYPLRSFVADETLDVELIGEDPTWPDKSGVGVRSRDLNPVGSTEEFLLQSPTIGPDVIVEFVATDHYQLGNFVVISFPASVIQKNETVMQNLSRDPNHDPSQWREDGRVFVAFAHLSDWEDWGLQRPQPGTYIDSPEKGIIGMTGNTGTQVNHLDLSVVYYGSMDDGTQQMRDALAAVTWDRASVDNYFGLAARSSFVGKPNVYAENVDPVRVWPELDELERAEYTKGESIYPWKN